MVLQLGENLIVLYILVIFYIFFRRWNKGNINVYISFGKYKSTLTNKNRR